MVQRRALLALSAALFATSTAAANPEPPGNYDARVVGMGTIAIPTIGNAAALFHNPAQLDRIERFSATVVATSLLVNLRAPFAGPGTEQDSGLIYAPLGFVGAAGRVHERVTLGLGAYVYTGFGGGFSAVECIANGDPSVCAAPDSRFRLEPPADQQVFLFVTEFALPVQVSIHERLSVGVTLRLPWARQDVRAHQDVPNCPSRTTPPDPDNPDAPYDPCFDTPTLQQANQELRGVGVPGVLVGVSYRPIDGLTLAATYRSKVWVNLDGNTSVPLVPGADPLRVPTSTRWYVPHMVRVGAAYTTWHERITLGFEFKVQLHEEANRSQRFDLDSPLAPDTEARFDWKNVYLGALGFEIWAAPRFAVRTGGTIARSASRAATLTPFSPPPGLQFSAYIGFGLQAGPIDVDWAFGWGGGKATRIRENHALCVDADRRLLRDGRDRTLLAQGGCAGSYDVDSWFLSLSATYPFGRPDIADRMGAAQEADTWRGAPAGG